MLPLKVYLMVALSSVFSVGPVFAADIVNINVTGRILPTPCVVDPGSVSQNINFGQLLGTDLRTAGSASAWVPFTVKLINCPAALVTATVTFQGTPYPTDATLYQNATSSGSATNMAIQMVDNSNRTLAKGNSTTMTSNIDPTLRTATFGLAARVITPGGNVGSGAINSVVTMTFTYQ
ncbi:S-fimbrial adhesin protein [Buttiauxella ferragutiae ATCC 51602]|jgi:minor fimbrial subunit|uniref:S-fimbrial adhesin protein n=1 Tax=Buttiauxella ferragutiae ATCC 51602 TaxID=1354252 RepID=A0ABX2W635_9ENTR|nr:MULTISPECIES: fimbrial protein [Buttiauxella]AYN26260.1 type 1 fimbrial protein [Buttiauxella sp. 3AFRM03]OAT26284.1 S-fimbrial adhesin protein [Buttiauxella ferragutiae ATCC 51602]TDN54530.1 minor fimbrial subunit [Buttiauxella sp. JUb87]UNK63438.1 fimbrial protein [Buttiauxella ferragutiae]